MSTITKGEREIIDVLALHDGIPAAEIEKDLQAPEMQGYHKAVRAMVDAGFRKAWEDNAEKVVENSDDVIALEEGLAKHSNFTVEFIKDVTAEGEGEGKQNVFFQQVKGYERACQAASNAGFRAAWVDDRMQPVGNNHGWIARNDL
ncbi:MAG: hypothetical protein ACOX69_00635 [Coriobacteriales bacterium]|jgi:isopentenyl diphosphate isomerase/L-lactate dehydrogenase-like FMN-dependent dehydrogenase